MAAALLRLDADVWGDLIDEGQAYLTAHLLVASALDPKTNVSKNYEKEYHRLMKSVTSGFRVA